MIADASTIDRSAFDAHLRRLRHRRRPRRHHPRPPPRRRRRRGRADGGGGLEITEESQDVYRGTNLGLEYFDLDICRLRYFGGTSNHWGGWTPRARRRRLPAQALGPALRLADRPARPRPLPRRGRRDPRPPRRHRGPRPAGAPERLRLPPLPVPLQPPTRFAEKYQAEIEASDADHPRASTPTSSTSASTTRSPTVTGAVFRSYDPADPGFTVKARAYALCTGGIENARLLLNFTSQIPEGIGNRTGWVGRCFADHPHFLIAECRPARPRARARVLRARPSSSWRSTPA